MKGIVGSLSTFGFITDSIELSIDRHFAYWIAAKRSQSLLIGKPRSFMGVIEEYDGNADRLTEAVKENLKSHFSELFNQVEVECTWAGMESKDDSKIVLTVTITIIEDEVVYDLGRSIIVSGKTYQLINEGKINASRKK